MKLVRRLGHRLARIPWVASAIEERADLSAFRERPSFRLALGLGLMALSYAMCWPLIAVLGYLAVRFREPLLIVVGGPAAYGLSVAVFAVGTAVAGTDMVKYGRLFMRWLVRRLVSRMAGLPDDQGAGAGSAAAAAPATGVTPTSTRTNE